MFYKKKNLINVNVLYKKFPIYRSPIEFTCACVYDRNNSSYRSTLKTIKKKKLQTKCITSQFIQNFQHSNLVVLNIRQP